MHPAIFRCFWTLVSWNSTIYLLNPIPSLLFVSTTPSSRSRISCRMGCQPVGHVNWWYWNILFAGYDQWPCSETCGPQLQNLNDSKSNVQMIKYDMEGQNMSVVLLKQKSQSFKNSVSFICLITKRILGKAITFPQDFNPGPPKFESIQSHIF